jgi:hypothetical protein
MTMFLQTLARAGRKYDCLERHSPRIGAEFLTQSLSQGIDDAIRIDPAARLYLVNERVAMDQSTRMARPLAEGTECNSIN